MNLHKYHALENDYLVLDAAEAPGGVSPAQIRALCARHTGLGSDGLLLIHTGPEIRVVVFNPDGSESAMSGNGMRIAARFLWDGGFAPAGSWFNIRTATRTVAARVDGEQVTVRLGTVTFDSKNIPMRGPQRQVLDETLQLDGETVRFSAAGVGNPHCVVHGHQPTPAVARRLGPLLERHESFPQRTNVQILQPLDRHAIQIEIWERGAGYTRASGSSSCAAAAVAIRRGWCESPVEVQMPGGRVNVSIDAAWSVTLTGAVQPVFVARPDEALLRTS